MQYPRRSVLSRLARWAPALVFMALIFYSSSQTDPAPALTRYLWDKWLHGGGYGVLALLYIRALRGESRSWRSIAIAAIVLTSIYAATDEFHQMFTPGRVPDVADWAADTIGGVVAVAVCSIVRKRQ